MPLSSPVSTASYCHMLTSVANVMKKDLTVLPADGMPLQRIAEIVQSTNYQGFPVVKSETDRTIIGFVRKTELRYALGKSRPHDSKALLMPDRAMRARNLSDAALCTFEYPLTDPTTPVDIVIPNRRVSQIAVEPSSERNSGVEAEQVDFGQYVDEVGHKHLLHRFYAHRRPLSLSRPRCHLRSSCSSSGEWGG